MKFFEDCCSCSRARRSSEHVGIELAESHVPTQASAIPIPQIGRPTQFPVIANVHEEGSKHKDVNEEIIRLLKDIGLQIGTKIGQGSFANVYKSLLDKQQAATKIFSADCKINSFEQEVEIMEALNHPNIIELYQSFRTECSVFIIVMELAETSLSEVIHCSSSDYSLGQALDWAVQCACGLEYLHSKKILHRDVKPSNLLLMDSRSILKICDFGLSRIFQEKMSKGVGSDPYMAPEVYKSIQYEEKCDVFSFAVTLWEMLSRTKPYVDISSACNIPEAVAHGNLRPNEGTKIPQYDQLHRLIKRCWHAESSERLSMARIVPLFDVMMEKFADFVPKSGESQSKSTVSDDVESLKLTNIPATEADKIITVPIQETQFSSSDLDGSGST